MEILTTRTGAEKYSNRLFTSDFYVIPSKKGEEAIHITDHNSYIPHEIIECGPASCFGAWQIGHITLPIGAGLFGVFTRKILAYDPHSEQREHQIRNVFFNVGGIKKERNYVLKYWGYNGGRKSVFLLQGFFYIKKQTKKDYPLSSLLSDLPF